MAIDDNTVYGLTGAQVKELPEKIEAVKGLAKVLTADDYNWPASNPNGVALWLLDSGVYDTEQGVKIYTSTGQSFDTGKTVFISKTPSGTSEMLLWQKASGSAGTTVSGFATSNAGANLSANNLLITSGMVENNLTSTSTFRPLSAAQGKALKDLIDAIVVPTKTSDLTNDGSDGTSTYVEADELATVATSGSYNDLSGQPTIPAVNDATLTITQNSTSVGTFTANASSNVTIDIETPTAFTTSEWSALWA